MEAKRKLLPGTKKLVEKYGEDLICVRYRYDRKRKIKIKTVELVEEKTPWVSNVNKTPMNKIVQIKVDYDEIHLRKAVKSVGGRWNKKKKVWEVAYKDVKNLGLVDRMVDGDKNV